jgi:hypothetical protein
MNTNIEPRRRSVAEEIIRAAGEVAARSVSMRVTEAVIEYQCKWDDKPRREWVRPSEAGWQAAQLVRGFGPALVWIRVTESEIAF